jgi:hypothetical protein
VIASSASAIPIPDSSAPSYPVALAELGQKVAEMKRQVNALEAEVKAAAAPAPAGPLLDRILEMTAELFPGKALLRQDIDPEDPYDPKWVVEIEATGTLAEILERKIEWHRRMDAIDIATSDRLRLCVFPK